MARIQALLVANRGEIARRIFRTCRRLGIRTIAVHSEADADAPHVHDADASWCLGEAAPSASYLDTQKIIDAAKATGADAIHPGYGFLSENADFARAVHQAGILFVGPTADVIEEMGSKQRAKTRARSAGVSVIPGYEGDDQSDERLVAEAHTIGTPLLIKASAGGGGKGMRIVRDLDTVPEALAAARREALSAFGDDRLLLERYIERPRHVEVQILGDQHGNVVHLWERDCSLQRRHQKVIEEAPAPGLPAEVRERICSEAVALGKAIGYSSAGTVEMILAPDGATYFLEVNTRLQVEHPVTEAITGVDLVELQIRIAEGHPLPFSAPPPPRGAAVECRLYAEDPTRGWLPQTGTLRSWSLPSDLDIRLDSGVESGSVVSAHYDPMLAKLIAWGDDRPTAIQRAHHALSRLAIHGVRTNRDALLHLLESESFQAATMHTHSLEDSPTVAQARPPSHELLPALFAAVLFEEAAHRTSLEATPGVRPGFRNLAAFPETDTFHADDATWTLGWTWDREGRLHLVLDDQEPTVWTGHKTPSGAWSVRHAARSWRVAVSPHGDLFDLHTHEGSFTFTRADRLPLPGSTVEPGSCLSPMPGKVIAVLIAEGDHVESGAPLIRLEAMKMEHTVHAPATGTVSRLLCAEGDQVDADAPLLVLQEEA